MSNGQNQLVLFSPEALLSVRRWREMLRDESYTSRIVAFVVDEAHSLCQEMVSCQVVGVGGHKIE